MKSTFFCFLISFTCICYSQQEEIDTVIRKCVNQNTSDYHLSMYSQKFESFYSMMRECESTMISSGMLKGKMKRDYLNLIESLSGQSIKSEYQVTIDSVNSVLSRNRYDISNYALSYYPISFCPGKAYESLNLGDESLVFKQLQMTDRIWTNGAKDLEPVMIFIEQLNEEQFNNQTYKTVIQLFIINYSKGKINEINNKTMPNNGYDQ